MQKLFRQPRTWHLAETFFIVLAFLMLIVILIPADYGNTTATDATIRGFDKNLIYIDKTDLSTSTGSTVNVLPDRMVITAEQGAKSIVHVNNAYVNYSTNFKVAINEIDSEGAFSIKLWSYQNGASYSILFGPSPGNEIKGVLEQDNKIIKNQILGAYQTLQFYDIKIERNLDTGIISGSINKINEDPPSGSNWIIVKNKSVDNPDYEEIASKYIPVEEGVSYNFGGLVKWIEGSDRYKIIVNWLDDKGKILGHSNDWESPNDLEGWTLKDFEATAPAGAANVSVLLSAANSTYLMTDLFFQKTESDTINLLDNGSFKSGDEGWELLGPQNNTEIADLIQTSAPDVSSEFRVTKADSASLFERLPFALSYFGETGHGMLQATVKNYTITVPRQIWLGTQGRRGIVTIAVLVLIAAGFAALIVQVWIWLNSRRKNSLSLEFSERKPKFFILITFSSLSIISAIIIYVILNVASFALSYHTFDFNIMRLAAYLGSFYDVGAIYKLSPLVSAPEMLGGAPAIPLTFHYGPVMAYLMSTAGWIYRIFFNDSSTGFQTIGLTIAVKSVNLLFLLGDALLIYLILQRLSIGKRTLLLVSGLFLFNPVVWFITSIWGQTHVISLFFPLLAIWLAQRNNTNWAWIALALTALTRTQMWLLALLLAVWFLRKFTLRQNLMGASWAVVSTFLLLIPVSISIGPNFLVNWFLDVNASHIFTSAERAHDVLVTNGMLNIWPLLDSLTSGASGRVARLWSPSTENLIGGLSFANASLILFGVVSVLAIVLMIKSRPKSVARGGYLLPFALIFTGLVILFMEIPSNYVILPLPFLLLLRKELNNIKYFTILAIWTIVGLIIAWGDFGYGVYNSVLVSNMLPALSPVNNRLTLFFMNVYSNDWFITIGSLLNVSVFILLLSGVRNFSVSGWLPFPRIKVTH